MEAVQRKQIVLIQMVLTTANVMMVILEMERPAKVSEWVYELLTLVRFSEQFESLTDRLIVKLAH